MCVPAPGPPSGGKCRGTGTGRGTGPCRTHDNGKSQHRASQAMIARRPQCCQMQACADAAFVTVRIAATANRVLNIGSPDRVRVATDPRATRAHGERRSCGVSLHAYRWRRNQKKPRRQSAARMSLTRLRTHGLFRTPERNGDDIRAGSLEPPRRRRLGLSAWRQACTARCSVRRLTATLARPTGPGARHPHCREAEPRARSCSPRKNE